MATVIFRCPATQSLRVDSVNGIFRVRPNEPFALDTAVSAQTDAFLAAGFDYTQHVSFGGATVSGAEVNGWQAHNPYGVS